MNHPITPPAKRSSAKARRKTPKPLTVTEVQEALERARRDDGVVDAVGFLFETATPLGRTASVRFRRR